MLPPDDLFGGLSKAIMGGRPRHRWCTWRPVSTSSRRWASTSCWEGATARCIRGADA
ncbi:MAG: hypothetical protein WKF75_05065 [Singulisphaera sp.]